MHDMERLMREERLLAASMGRRDHLGCCFSATQRLPGTLCDGSWCGRQRKGRGGERWWEEGQAHYHYKLTSYPTVALEETEIFPWLT